VLGSWRAPGPLPERPPFGEIPAPRARVVIVDKPDAGRTALYSGRVTIERASPDYYAAIVAVAVLSGYSGRLNQEIRVKRGLSYGAGAMLAVRRMPGLFLSSTLIDHTRAVEAVEVTRRRFDRWPKRRRPTKTWSNAKRWLRWILSLDRDDRRYRRQCRRAPLYDVPLGEINEYARRVQDVDAASVSAFAARGLVPDDFVVLVGDAAKFAGEIGRTHADVRVIPFDALDLGSPTLGV